MPSTRLDQSVFGSSALTLLLILVPQVAASENTEDPGVPKTKQHALFVLATNCAIDVGFVIAA